MVALRNRRRLQAAVLATGSLIVALVAAELVARLTVSPPPLRRVWDPFAYRIPQPGLVDPIDGPDGPVTVRMDDRGMRRSFGGDPSRGTPIRVVFLGGSTTENYPYPVDETFPGRVGAAIAAACGRPTEVRNAGASAATAATSLARLQHQVLDLEPDAVVVMHAINDLIGGFAPGYRPDQRHLPRPATPRRPRSYLIHWFRTRRAGKGESGAAREPAPAIDDWRAHPSFPPYQRTLRSIVAVGRAHHVPLVLMTQATTYESPLDPVRNRLARRHRAGGAPIPSADSLAVGMATFNDAVRHLATDVSTPLVDLARSLPDDANLFFDECHLTADGNRAAANLIAPVLIELLGCDASPPGTPAS